MKQVIKRDKELENFDEKKIKRAITKANNAIKEENRITEEQIDEIVESVIFDIGEDEKIDIEKIQDAVEKELTTISYPIAKAYILKREERSRERRKASKTRKIQREKLTASNVQNSNANVDEYSFGGRLGEAGNETAKQIALDEIVTEQTRKNYENNEIYIHDISSYAIGDHNCLSCPLDDLLANGFNTRQTDIRPAGSLNTAFQLVAVLFQIQSLQQFGGISGTHLDWTMVPYFRKSLMKHYIVEYLKNTKKFNKLNIEEKMFETYVDDNGIVRDVLDDWISENKKEILKKIHLKESDFTLDNKKLLKKKFYKSALFDTIVELKQSAEGMFHNLNSLQSRAGSQLPFSSINYGTCTLPEGRMISKALLDGCIKGVGKFNRTSIFPCVIFQYKKGVNDKPGAPNYDLYQLALESTARRLYPNYANCDWSNQTKWVDFDRNIKQEVLDELSEEEKEKLISLIKENPEIGKQLSLKLEG